MKLAPRTRRNLLLGVQLLSVAWFLVYFWFHYVVGALNVDEIYFAHTLWLVLNGKRQFVDFFSQHFPTYFTLYAALLPRPADGDLSFVWFVRFSNLLVFFAYVVLLWRLERERWLVLLPLLLLFIDVSRMIEIRTDTIALLLFNAAWVMILRDYSRARLVLGSVLALAGACFSARGFVMGVGFAAVVIGISIWRRDICARAALFVLALVAAVTAAAIYLLDPGYAKLLINSAFLMPATMLAHLTVGQRLVGFDRLPQLLLIVAALATAIACLAKRREPYKAIVIIGATLMQLLLIFFDPSPFPYVYAWACLPVIAGLGMAIFLHEKAARPLLAFAPGASAFLMVLAILTYPIIKGREAPVGSNFRLFPDPPLATAALREMQTDALVELMLSREHQQSLSNQLKIRTELCHRVHGTVMATWQNHPICTKDANYYWYELNWPNLLATGQAPRGVPWFERIFREQPPELVIWSAPGSSTELNLWAKSLFAGYELHDGFGLRHVQAPGEKR